MDTPSFSPDLVFFTALLDASPDLIFYKDSEGRYRLVNEALLKDLGLPREAILGRRDADIFPLGNANRHVLTDQRILASGRPATVEYEVEHAGRSLWLQVLKSPVRDASGRLIGLFCIGRNITLSKEFAAAERQAVDILEQRVADRTQSLRRANERLRHAIKQRQQAENELADSLHTLNLILDNSPIGITFVVNRLIVRANPRFYELFGQTPGAISGQSTQRIYPSAASFEEFGRLYYPKLARGERVDVVWTMRRADGTDFYCRVIGQLLFPDRPQEGSIWLMEDVTKQRLAEEATLAAERLKREFVDTISHELRTPLNGILGMAEVLDASPLSEAQHDDLRTLKESAQALAGLLENILDFSRLETDTPSAAVRFRPRGLLEGVMHSLAGLAQHKGLTLTSQADETIPELLLGDAEGVRRVLAALVSNAVKFTERGGVTVILAREASADAPPSGDAVTVSFTVTDTGIGLLPEHLATIFEPFRQADGSHTRRFGGAGLGLAIARKTAEAMGGRIDVSSVLGHGSTFRFTVTLAADAPAASPR